MYAIKTTLARLNIQRDVFGLSARAYLCPQVSYFLNFHEKCANLHFSLLISLSYAYLQISITILVFTHPSIQPSIHPPMDGWLDGWIVVGWIDGWMDGCVNTRIQTNILQTSVFIRPVPLINAKTYLFSKETDAILSGVTFQFVDRMSRYWFPLGIHHQ